MWIEAHATLWLFYRDGTIFWCCHTGGSDWRIVRAEISWEAVTPGDRQPRRLSHLYAAPLPPRPEGTATWYFRPAATQLRSPAVVQLLRSPGIAWTVRTFRTFWRLRLHPFWSGKPGFEHLAASKQWDNGRFELKWLVLKESELLRLSQTCNLKAHISLKHWSTAQTAHVTWVTCQFFTSFKCTSAVALGFSGAALGARLCLASKVGEIFHPTCPFSFFIHANESMSQCCSFQNSNPTKNTTKNLTHQFLKRSHAPLPSMEPLGESFQVGWNLHALPFKNLLLRKHLHHPALTTFNLLLLNTMIHEESGFASDTS